MRWMMMCVISLGLASMQGCVTNPSTGRTQLDLLSGDQVAAMGEEATPALVQEYGGQIDSAEVRSYVSEVGQRLAAETEDAYSDIEWEFFVLDSEVINAFALPGGHVFISRGLMERFNNEAQLAGVLGHEIGHVTAKHVNERLSQMMIYQFGLDFLKAYTETELINQGAGVLGQTALLKYGRDQEREADMQGLKYMTAAGYDPQAMVEVLEVLMEAAGGGGTLEIFATHPNPASRRDEVLARIDQQYRHTQGDSSFQKHSDRYQQRALRYLR